MQLEALEAYLTSGVLVPNEYADEDEGQLDAVSKWLDEHVAFPPCDADKVARVVMRSVLRAGVGGDDPPSASSVCRTIKCCAKLLKKCTIAEPAPKRIVSQAGCLYEVQAFCHAYGWPAGLIKKLFYQLYEADVVFEDAYGVWREDVNDVTPGKDKALFQVNDFLQWLDEAVEDDGEDEQ